MKDLSKSYLSRKQASEKYPFLTQNMLKNILYKNIRGFRNQVVCKVGRRLLLDEEALLAFLADCKEGSTSNDLMNKEALHG